MKIISLLSDGIILLVAIHITSCSKNNDDGVYYTHFYVSDSLSSDTLVLYLNNDSRGVLSHMQQSANNTPFGCGSLAWDHNNINLQLHFGHYDYFLKNTKGVIKAQGYIDLSNNKTGMGGTMGSGGLFAPNNENQSTHEVSGTDNCIEVWLRP